MFCTVMAYSWKFIICNNKSWSSHSWCKYGKQVTHRRHTAHSQRNGSLTVRSKQAVGLLPPWNGHLLHIFAQLYPRCPVDLHQLKIMKEIMKVKSSLYPLYNDLFILLRYRKIAIHKVHFFFSFLMCVILLVNIWTKIL